MTKTKELFRLTCIASVLAGLYSSAGAEPIDPERVESIGKLTAVSSEVRLGLAVVSDDNRRFGQYSGLNEDGVYALADVSYASLDKASGTWTKVYGRNLGLDSRELWLDHYRQGQTRFQFGFSQTPRYEPMLVNTGLTGIGSTAQTVNGTTLRPVDLNMKRELVALGFEQTVAGNNVVRVRYTHEDKDGARLFGRGATAGAANTPPAAIEFLTEPINRNTQTLEVSLSHTGKALQLSGGYYGTLFVNHSNRLDAVGTANNALSNAATNGGTTVPAFSPMSMPLNNDSHQLFLTGGYNLLPMTRLGFKTSYTVARQNEQFMDVSGVPGSIAAPVGAPKSLDGQVDTMIGYFDITSLEFDRLDLQANVRYEDRDDKTPQALYLNTAPASATLGGFDGRNKPRSWRSLKSKFEAGYQLPMAFKLVGSWELEQQKRNVPEPQRRVGFRAETDEATSRVEIKRMIAESATGAISFSQAKRTGSDYITDTYVIAGLPSSDINPLLWADRVRDTWRATLDWAPLDDLGLRFQFDQSDDQYRGREKGPREGARSFYSIDASYALNSRWQLTAFFSRDDTTARQRTHTGVGPTQHWQADLRLLGDAAGMGLQAKLRSGIELGGDLNYYRESAEHRMSAVSPGFVVNSLPDYTYEISELKLFGTYPLSSAASVRIDYAYQDWKTNDWTWNGWGYSDGTTLTQDTSQQTHYLGASYAYRW